MIDVFQRFKNDSKDPHYTIGLDVDREVLGRMLIEVTEEMSGFPMFDGSNQMALPFDEPSGIRSLYGPLWSQAEQLAEKSFRFYAAKKESEEVKSIQKGNPKTEFLTFECVYYPEFGWRLIFGKKITVDIAGLENLYVGFAIGIKIAQDHFGRMFDLW